MTKAVPQKAARTPVAEKETPGKRQTFPKSRAQRGGSSAAKKLLKIQNCSAEELRKSQAISSTDKSPWKKKKSHTKEREFL